MTGLGGGRIDRIDLNILAQLQRRGRMTNVDLAAAVGLSACGGGGEDSAGSKTVRVTLANHVWTENIKNARKAG